MFRLFEELRRRNVVKATISYVVLSYALLEISSLLLPILGIDKDYVRVVFIALAIIFPIWVVFSYIYEWTPEGFKQTNKVPEEESIHEATGKKLNHYIIAGLSVVIVLLVVDRIFNVTSDIIEEDGNENVIAVLPFSHLSPEPTDEFFTSGVYEDVMTKLAGVQEFRIISKSSVMSYKGYEGDLTELGKRLNADFILQGTVRRWENEVRITAQLVNTKTNQAIWSHESDGELKNVFVLQSTIASEIANKLQANLSKSEQDGIESIPTNSLAAYDDYLKARYISEQPRPTYDNWTTAVRLLNSALEVDPKFAKAWTLLVQAHSERYSILARVEDDKTESELALAEVKKALAKAQALAPENWELLSEEGFYHFYIEKDPISALTSFEKAIARNPSDVASMHELSKIYVSLGDLPKAVDMMERGFQLIQSNGLISYGLTFSYEMNGDFDKMVPLLERLYELYPKQKHYLVESKYYQFLSDGKISSFQDFKTSVEESDTEFPWDERAIQNKEMVVAMFTDQFDRYHENWVGKNEEHTKSHGQWICPLVANDHINHARLLLDNGDKILGQQILTNVSNIVLRPIDRNTVCVFNPGVYLPKLDYLSGNRDKARQKLEGIVAEVLNNDHYLTGATERSVLLQAADMIDPEKVYYYYDLVAKNSISMSSFEKICADPWTYPNLIKHPKFISEIKEDGRFVAFLESFGFLKG